MFDAYHKWLGIPVNEQPPNHYRLLGISLFESDSEVIDAAANRQSDFLKTIAKGDNSLIGIAQQLQKEIHSARKCLTHGPSKRIYDNELQANFSMTLPTETQTVGNLFVEEQEDLLEIAQQAYIEGHFAHVVDLLKDIRESDPSSLHELLKLAKLNLTEINN